MSCPNPILNASNQALEVTNFLNGNNDNGRSTLASIPLGATGDSPTGELGVKVIMLNASSVGGPGGIVIPVSDYVGFTYYGLTNNIHVATYKTGGSGGTTVATLTYAYVGLGAADNDDISSITKT